MKHLVEKVGQEENFQELVKRWEATGLLWFLDKNHGEELVKILETGARMLINSRPENEHTRSSTLFFPALTRIYMSFNALKESDSSYSSIKSIPEEYEASKVLTDRLKDDIQFVLLLLEDYDKNFMPLGEKYLNHIDWEAELLKDFCDNYCLGKIQIYKKEIGV